MLFRSIDPLHIRIAREYFGIRYANVRIVQGDARRWLRQHQQRWDYLIDDVFQHGEDDPLRPFELDRSWYALLAERLNPGGAIIQNHIDLVAARAAARTLRSHGLKTLELETAGYANRVVAAFDSQMPAARLRAAVERQLAAMPRSVTRRLRHRLY